MITSDKIQLLRTLGNRFTQSEQEARTTALEYGAELGLNEMELKSMRTESLIHAVVFRLFDESTKQVEEKAHA